MELYYVIGFACLAFFVYLFLRRFKLRDIKRRGSYKYVIEFSEMEIEEIEYPRFMVCPECNNHGILLLEDYYRDDLVTKKQSLKLIEDLYEDNIISISDKIILEHQVNNSSLPNIFFDEDVSLN